MIIADTTGTGSHGHGESDSESESESESSEPTSEVPSPIRSETELEGPTSSLNLLAVLLLLSPSHGCRPASHCQWHSGWQH